MIPNSVMRFCPFCAQENPDEVPDCVHCGKQLPSPRPAPSRVTPPPRPPVSRPVPPRPAPRPVAAQRGPDPFAQTAVPGTLLALHDTDPVNTEHPTEAESPPARASLAAPSPGAARPESSSRAGRESTRQHTEETSFRPRPVDRDDTKSGREPTRQHTEEAPFRPRPVDRDDTKETELPVVHTTPTGTLLGLPARDLAAITQPAPEADSARRITQPLPAPLLREATRIIGDDDSGVTQVGPPPGLADEAPAAPSLVPPPPPAPRRKTAVGGVPVTPVPWPVEQESGPSDEGATDEAAPSELGTLPPLPPMPAQPTGGTILQAVQYLPPLGKAIWARKRAQKTIAALLHGDQRLLDSVLRDLGRVAREVEIDSPALAAEMRAVYEQEAQRDLAVARIAEHEAARVREDERWSADQAERQAEIARREGEVEELDEALRLKAEERRRHEAERDRVEAQIRSAKKRAAAALAKAEKVEALPADKGGGPRRGAELRAEASAADQDAQDLLPNRDAAAAAAAELDEPIAALTQQVVEARAALQQMRKELTAAKAEHEKTVAELVAARAQAAAERDAAERELTQRFVSAGTVLNLNRVDHPRLSPLYARIDDLKGGINAREAAIARLEAERQLYDRAAVQKGLLAVGVVAGAVILLAIILIVLLSR